MGKEVDSGMIRGDSHQDLSGGEDMRNVSSGEEYKVEGGEFIVKKSAMEDDTIRTYKGTNKEIISSINKTAGGNPADDQSQATKLAKGGDVNGSKKVIIKKELHPDLDFRNFWMAITEELRSREFNAQWHPNVRGWGGYLKIQGVDELWIKGEPYTTHTHTDSKKLVGIDVDLVPTEKPKKVINIKYYRGEIDITELIKYLHTPETYKGRGGEIKEGLKSWKKCGGEMQGGGEVQEGLASWRKSA